VTSPDPTQLSLALATDAASGLSFLQDRPAEILSCSPMDEEALLKATLAPASTLAPFEPEPWARARAFLSNPPMPSAGDWKLSLIGALSHPHAPGALSRLEIFELARRARPTLSGGALQNLLTDLCGCRALGRMRHGVYLNTSRSPKPRIEEALRIVRPKAVVSLGSALGESGAANNPSREVLAILPRGDVGVCLDPVELLPTERARFFSLRAESMLPGDADAWNAQSPFAAFTPEKSLLDWLALGGNGRSCLPVPPNDIDLDSLDVPKLLRLSSKLNMDAPLLEWVNKAHHAKFGQETAGEISVCAPDLIVDLQARHAPVRRRSLRR